MRPLLSSGWLQLYEHALLQEAHPALYRVDGDWDSLWAAVEDEEVLDDRLEIRLLRMIQAVGRAREGLAQELGELTKRFKASLEALCSPIWAFGFVQSHDAAAVWPQLLASVGRMSRRASSAFDEINSLTLQSRGTEFEAVFGSEPVSTEAGRQSKIHSSSLRFNC